MQGGGCSLSHGTRRILQERQRHSLKASQAAAAMAASGLLNQVHIITICAVLCCAVLGCDVMSCHVMSCHVMSCDMMSCDAMCYALLCCSMVCLVTKPVLYCAILEIGRRLADSLPLAVLLAAQANASLALPSLFWCL